MSFIPDTVPEQKFFQGDKTIGPSFLSELEAHGGLVGEHFTWWLPGKDDAIATIEFFEDTPQPVIDGVLAVYAAHDPTKKAPAV